MGPSGPTGFHPGAVSRGGSEKLSLTVGGEGEAGADVFRGEFGEVFEDFGFGHAGGEVFQDVVNRNPHPPEAGFAAALPRFDGDEVDVIHRSSLALNDGIGNHFERIARVGWGIPGKGSARAPRAFSRAPAGKLKYRPAQPRFKSLWRGRQRRHAARVCSPISLASPTRRRVRIVGGIVGRECG